MGYSNDLARAFIDQNRYAEIAGASFWEDGTPLELVELTQQDLEIITDALKRRFIQVKKGRTQVLHAQRAIYQRMTDGE